jgi:hypothetical protein
MRAAADKRLESDMLIDKMTCLENFEEHKQGCVSCSFGGCPWESPKGKNP